MKLGLGLGFSKGSGPVNIVAPSISGTRGTGNTLTVTPGTWTLDPIITYQWYRTNGIFSEAISGATSSTYDDTTDDYGWGIYVAEIANGNARANSNTLAGLDPLTDGATNLTFFGVPGLESLTDGNTYTTFNDRSSNNFDMTTLNSTTFTYNEEREAFVKTTTTSCFESQAAHYGTAADAQITVMVFFKLQTGRSQNGGNILTLGSSSAALNVTSDSVLRYLNNEAAGAVTAPGVYDMRNPTMACFRLDGDAGTARFRVNDGTDATFDPNNTWNTNTFVRIGSTNGTTAAPESEYYAAMVWSRYLTDNEVAERYSWALANLAGFFFENIMEDTAADNSNDLAAFLARAVPLGEGYIPANTYIISSNQSAQYAGSLHLRGDGETSIYKLADNTITDGSTPVTLMTLQGNSADLLLENFAVDMNYQNQVAPDEDENGAPSGLQQASAISIRSMGVRGWDQVTIRNMVSSNPIGDGFTIRGSAAETESFGDIIFDNITEDYRPYTRSSCTITAPFDSCIVRNCIMDSFEIESDYDLEGYDKTTTVQDCVLKELDINFNTSAVLNVPNVYVYDTIVNDRRVNLVNANYEVDRCEFHLGLSKISIGKSAYSIKNTLIRAKSGLFDDLASGIAIIQSDVEDVEGDGYTILFENVDFENLDFLNTNILFRDLNKLQDGQEIIFRNCTFDENCRIDVRSGRVTFDGGSSAFSSSTEAFFYQSNKRDNLGVTNVYSFTNFSCPDAWIFAPNRSLAADNYSYTVVDGGGNISSYGLEKP